MSDALDHGITVTEISAMDQPIDVSSDTTAAFVGRTLRGPLNTPILVESFAAFRRRFGDTWSRSSLGPAVRQFFDHGGKQLHIVRVANAARGAMLCLPAEGTALVLRSVEPGSTELLRAAVDYDGVDKDSLFNLTLQRVSPDSGLVLDQEMHRNVSFETSSERFVGDVLGSSTLARIEQPYPQHRPERTETGDYIDAVQKGSDGEELSDYDLVGSRQDGTGLFALNGVEHFDLLYIPPPGRNRDLGPTATLAAELYCRERGAMLVVDPSCTWESVDDAVTGMRDLGYASPNMLGYFPRLVERRDRQSGPRAAGGAISGLLCRLDRDLGPWHSTNRSDVGFSRKLEPALALSQDDQRLLTRAGLNLVLPGSAARPALIGNRTMGRGSEAHSVYSSLSTRRLCLHIVNTIDHATRWAVFEQPDARLMLHVQGQVGAFMALLADLEAFEGDHYTVECTTLSGPAEAAPKGLSLDISFRPMGAQTTVSLTLQQSSDGLRVAGTAFARNH